jgi:hypothetical protein
MAAVDSWYKTIESYDWSHPSISTFSQVVWKATTDIGVGVSSNAGAGLRTVVVVAYSPPGNVMGADGDDSYYKENVSPRQ